MKTRALMFFALFTLTLGACDADEASTREGVAAADEGRGGLGKADHVEGSCAPDEDGDVCGGPAPVGNCWCDEACVRWGDCCDDAWNVCGVGEPPAPEPEVDCDDGSSLHPLCDIKPPCDDGQVAAVINSCFQCVDALTCE
jgi:hypothetical protein